jgi:hypothetical protein
MEEIKNVVLAQKEPSTEEKQLAASAPITQEKRLFELNKSDTVFSVCAVAFSVFTFVFGVFSGYALGYLISCLLMAGLFIAYFAKSSKFRFLPAFCGFLSVAISAVFICTSNVSVRFFGAAVSFLLGLLAFDNLVFGSAKGNRSTIDVFFSALSSAKHVPVAIKSLFVNADGDKKSLGKALIGLICAVPVLVVIVPLLISSDDAFSGMMSDIFGNSVSTVFKVIFGLVASLFVISYGFSIKKDRVTRSKKGDIPTIESIYIASFLSAISICYLLYLFSQLAYFFSAFKGFLPNGQITYAQYARKGFFEMCAIAVINLVLVFVSLIFAKKKNAKVTNGVKVLTTFISCFTLVIISTAISKMVLYINEYGMTVLRLTTSAFMVFLTAVFISVILRIYLEKINIVKTALVAAGCILLVLGTVNVNGVCAKYNYESYVSKKLPSIDVTALYDLGDEGVPYLAKLADDKDEKVVKEAKKYLAQAFAFDYFEDMHNAMVFSPDTLKGKEKYGSFGHFSLPRKAAYQSLYTFLTEHPSFVYTCDNYLKDSF